MFQVVFYPRPNPLIKCLSKSGFKSQKACEAFAEESLRQAKINMFGVYRKDYKPYRQIEIQEVKKGQTKTIRAIFFIDEADIIEKVAI